MMVEAEEERREFTTSEDDEGEHVNIEFDDNDHDSNKGPQNRGDMSFQLPDQQNMSYQLPEQTRDEIERQLNKVESYPSESNSPSNSSEDGNQSSYGTKKPGRKTDRQRVESGARREWSDAEILSLIQLWRDNDILYNTNHPLYYVQTERKLAMDHISNELRITVKDVNDKMHSLRTYYCSQRQRLGSLINSHGDSKQFSRWKFYDQMSFLYESVTNRAFKSSMSGKARRKREMQRTDFDYKPYMNIHSDAHMTSRSPARLYETGGYGTPPMYPDNPPVLHEREDKDGMGATRMPPSLGDGATGGGQRRRSIDLNNQSPEQLMEAKDQQQQMFSSSPPNIVGKDLGGCGVAEKEIVGKLNPGDEMFGHMVATSLSLIEDEQQKELLKLNLQTMIYNVRFRKGLQQNTFPS